MAVSARVQLTSKNYQSPTQVEVVLRPVATSDPDSPNYSFSKYTPSGELKLTITNPTAYDFFEFGKTYDVLFTETVTVKASSGS